jgi:repressor LexA
MDRRPPNRIRQLRKARGLTLEQLAALVPHPVTGAATDVSTISKLELSKRALTTDWMHRLAGALGVEPAALLASGADFTPVRRVPLIGTIAAGNWREAIEDPLSLVPCESGGANTFALVVDGDSMDLIVPPGGRIYIDPDDFQLRDGKYYAVMREGETTFKRYRASPARLEPCSTNAAHRPIEIGREPFTVIGRVVGTWRDLD